MKLKKLTALFLAILMLFGALSISSYATDTEETIALPRSITIASAVYRNFYSYSGGNTVTLSRGCNYVSFKVTCSSGTDSVYARITDITHNGDYNCILPFPADGSTTTFETYFAAGSYEIEIYGSNMLHTLGLVAFST